MLHLPLLRAGNPYRSLETLDLKHVATGEPVARVSQANAGLVRRDLLHAAENRRQLQRRSAAELLAVCRRAAQSFVADELPLDPLEGRMQTPQAYVESLSATTGLPRSLCLGNMEKIRFVLAEMETVLGGLTRGLDLEALDRGFVIQAGRPVSYVAEADALGAILPSNSPGVHSLWLPAVPLKIPLVLKPGGLEPWTPLRVAQALLASGCPPGALSVYPANYSAATEILLGCGRSMLFGDVSTVAGWRHDPRVQIHGPGWSKVLIGEDRASEWRHYLDLMVSSIADNGGRSCLNASGVWLPAHGREVAEALAERLAGIEARPLDHPQAALAAFPRPEVARRISEFIDSRLLVPGAIDLTARYRGAERLVEIGGCTFLLPTLVWCEDPEHPLAAAEFLFPFAAVVEVPRAELVRRIGSTLVATAVTDDSGFASELLGARNIDRLNFGEIPTSRVSWDQPHEGNLFGHLYRQRALQQERSAS